MRMVPEVCFTYADEAATETMMMTMPMCTT
jgi:hypothetical protein